MTQLNHPQTRISFEILLFPVILMIAGFSKVSRILTLEPYSSPLHYVSALTNDLLFLSATAVLLILLKRAAPKVVYIFVYTFITTSIIGNEFFAWKVFQETGLFLDWTSIEFSLERLDILKQMLDERLTSLQKVSLIALPILLIVSCLVPFGITLNFSLLAITCISLWSLFAIYVTLGNFFSLPIDQFRATTPNLIIGFFESLDHEDPLTITTTENIQESEINQSTDSTPPNIVIIILESTRDRSVEPYTNNGVTPFFKELSEESLLFMNAYSTSPHTSRAIYSMICGNFPRSSKGIYEAAKGGIQHECLPHLLNRNGYRSAYFQSATESFEDRRQLVENMGYQDFFPVETFNTENYEKANYFGYEDDVMLPKSKEWLSEHQEQPKLVTYLTVTPHLHYDTLSRYGWKEYNKKPSYNAYLNTLHYQDNFLRNLFDQYKALGIYENTIFIVAGDHGEGFREHNLYGHGMILYEEGVRVPYLIHYGDRLEGREDKSITLMDIAPSALSLAGFEFDDTIFEGMPFNELPATDRDILLNCGSYDYCSALIDGKTKLKYTYYYGRRGDTLFNLSEDPLEKNNLIKNQDFSTASTDLKNRLLKKIEDIKTPNDIYSRKGGANIAVQFFPTNKVPESESLSLSNNNANHETVLHASTSQKLIRPEDIFYLEYTVPYRKGACVVEYVEGIKNNKNRKHIFPEGTSQYITIKQSYNAKQLAEVTTKLSYRENCDLENETILGSSIITIPIELSEDDVLFDKRTYLSYVITKDINESVSISGKAFIQFLFTGENKPSTDYFSEKFREGLKEKFSAYNAEALQIAFKEAWCSREDEMRCIYRFKVEYNQDRTLEIRLYTNKENFTHFYYYNTWKDQLEL